MRILINANKDYKFSIKNNLENQKIVKQEFLDKQTATNELSEKTF